MNFMASLQQCIQRVRTDEAARPRQQHLHGTKSG
jgi:hypothetical protein